jgi:polyhydroxybutyrate depolymerase
VGFSGGSTANDVGFLSALIDTLHAQYGIDLNRVYSTGFSNGGFMSYRLACELSGRIAAIAPVAGTMTDAAWGNCQPSRDIPVMHIHGTNDLVVFYNGGFGNKSVDEVLELWRGFSNCPANSVIVNLPDLVAEGSTVQTQTWAPCDEAVEVVHYKVVNGGHTWPGSVGTTGVGNTNRDISASDEIWKFVSRFSLNLPTAIPDISPEEVICHPNPFSEYATIRFALLHEEHVKLEIHTLSGTKVITVVDELLNAGNHQIRVNRGDLPAGISIFRLQSGNRTVVGKLVVL